MVSAEEKLTRFADEMKADPRTAPLVALVPTGRQLALWDVLPLVPVVMGRLHTADDVVEVLDAAAHAYARAAGLHFLED